MYRFHITGYASIDRNSYQYNSDAPIDITIYADTARDALDKAEKVGGDYISTTHRKITIEELTDKEHIEGLEYILMGVMHSVDKWLEGEELDEGEVNRAATMREKVLRIIEDKDARIQELKVKLRESEILRESAYRVVGEVVDTPNPFNDTDKRINDALDIAWQYSQIDGAHHKAWSIDQMVRALLGGDAEYNKWITKYTAPISDEPDDYYEWDVGIAP